ncbi:acetyl-CoA synthetase-like protein [Dacryopinax primogenitus]|uniref:Acetyl-CoA synthetase-like protein n=1 Tax=Dacryopinax primogenitus (strain DJM 731) TaxID=1858805 RepID=M5FWG5_DACPD|nr:acetyl-CoA synthetase-like protein [Dacryopinax primogenitus]EJU02271.1 acetyl-CoA synthetase-like protein [Dacryopinax primogenitus]
MHERADQYGAKIQGSSDKRLRWTYGEMDRAIDALAKGLVAMGVTKGDRVGAVLPNCSAYALLQWATARIGAILVTFNPQYKTHELLAALNLTTSKALFITPYLKKVHFLQTLIEALPSYKLDSLRQHELAEPALPALRSLVLVDNLHDPDEDGLEASEVKRLEASNTKDEVINLQFTSGTTGLPKAVSLTHFNLLNNGRYIGDCMRLTPADRLCNVPPLFHCFGLVLGNLAAWTHGSTIIYPSGFFDPRAILDTVEAEKCTALHGVPTHFLGVLGELETGGKKWDTSTLRTGIAAGSPIPIELMKELIENLALTEVTIAYGMTETSPVSFQTRTDDPLTKRAETVGRIMPQTKAKIVDEHGNIVRLGEHGELCVAGYLVQKGYWEDQEQTDRVLKRHPGDPDTLWMMTGDVASMDAEGYLQIVGRIKDIIIRGGENLFPVQIENCLTDHHAIREAAVVSVPDSKYVEVPGAWVVRSNPKHPGAVHLSAKDVRKVVFDGMNRQNAPDYVWFLGEDGVPGELPKTASGKVMKHVLRKWSKNLAEKGIGRVV